MGCLAHFPGAFYFYFRFSLIIWPEGILMSVFACAREDLFKNPKNKINLAKLSSGVTVSGN